MRPDINGVHPEINGVHPEIYGVHPEIYGVHPGTRLTQLKWWIRYVDFMGACHAPLRFRGVRLIDQIRCAEPIPWHFQRLNRDEIRRRERGCIHPIQDSQNITTNQDFIATKGERT